MPEFLVDDRDLRHVHRPRHECIGARSDPFGPPRVNVYDASGALAATAFTETTNFCWVSGLTPNTEYRDEVIVDEPRRRCEVAQAIQAAFEQHDVRLIVTTGDNIYAGRRILGMPVGGTGNEDDDWFFTFFQPYRYMINRIPVYPCIGNHDTAETEDRDDREQPLDNLYLRERIAGDEASGRASVDPGLFYRFRYGRGAEFICIDVEGRFLSRQAALRVSDALGMD